MNEHTKWKVLIVETIMTRSFESTLKRKNILAQIVRLIDKVK